MEGKWNKASLYTLLLLFTQLISRESCFCFTIDYDLNILEFFLESSINLLEAIHIDSDIRRSDIT